VIPNRECAVQPSQHENFIAKSDQIPYSGPTKSRVNRKKARLQRFASPECVESVKDTYSWAKYVIFFIVLTLTWVVVGFVYFCLSVRSGTKIAIILGAVIASIVWTIMAIATGDLMYTAFFRAFRSTIC
jgi:hypothetical protein